jgi:proteasome alpha subunit
MISEEPYRWLEAIRNRREYIEDQMQSGMPVVAISGTPGILFLTTRASTPKVFEIYDHLALGCLGHPADLEKVRQAAIDAAHLEGFTRSPHDVTSRRLVNYNIGPAIKNAFEQIFSAPLMFRGILADLGPAPDQDSAWLLDYDGAYTAPRPQDFQRGLVVAGYKRTQQNWEQLNDRSSSLLNDWPALTLAALRIIVWAHQLEKTDQHAEWNDTPQSLPELLKLLPDGLEAAVLDRKLIDKNIAYRVPAPAELGL